MCSVTRFVRYFTILAKNKGLWQFSKGFFRIRQYFEPTLAKSGIGQIFVVVNGEILKNNLAIRSHWCVFATNTLYLIVPASRFKLSMSGTMLVGSQKSIMTKYYKIFRISTCGGMYLHQECFKVSHLLFFCT